MAIPGLKQARSRPQTAPSKKKARYISAETWALWEDDVKHRYIVLDQSLKQIMHEYSELYGFQGTYVQYSFPPECRPY
jgi:hypothetical protein